MLYLWIKAFHLISIVVWFAGLFYLPRLFVYHSATEDENMRKSYATMERRLYRIIMNPAVMVVFILGFILLWLNPAVAYGGWFHIKLVLVLALLVYHIFCGRIMRSFAEGESPRTTGFYRLFNEVPTVFLIAIVILAVVKPF